VQGRREENNMKEEKVKNKSGNNNITMMHGVHPSIIVITLNFSTHAYMALALLLAFFSKALLSSSS
jgi:hypothetical protein